MDWIQEHWTDLVAAVGGLMIVARVIVRLTPTQADDNWLAKVQRVLALIGLHVPEEKAKKGVARLPLLACLAAAGLALTVASGCTATRESQLLQVEVLKQVREEWQGHHKALTTQIRADKAQALDLAFRVDLAGDAVDGMVPVEKVHERLATRQEKMAEVDANLAALDAQFQQRIDLVNRAIELGAVTAETLDAWAQVQLLIANEATNPTLVPMFLEDWQ